MGRIRKAVIPAAGWGTRLLPATKSQPKEMLPVLDEPVLETVLRELYESGITDTLIITGRGKTPIEDHFGPHPELETHLECKEDTENLELVKRSTRRGIHYTRQHEQNGLGDAVNYARSFVNNGPFMLVLGDAFFVTDTPVTKQMMEKYKKIQRPLVALEEVDEDKLSSYGIAKVEMIDGDFLIKDLVEKPGKEKAKELELGVDGKYYAIIGWYLLESSIFSYLDDVKPDEKGEIQLTDALRAQAKKEHIYGVLSEGTRYDIGTKEGYYRAVLHAGPRHPKIGKYAEDEILKKAEEIKKRRSEQ